VRAAGLCSRQVGLRGNLGGSPPIANDLADMAIRYGGEYGTAWVCLKAQGAPQTRSGRLKTVSQPRGRRAGLLEVKKSSIRVQRASPPSRFSSAWQSPFWPRVEAAMGGALATRWRAPPLSTARGRRASGRSAARPIKPHLRRNPRRPSLAARDYSRSERLPAASRPREGSCCCVTSSLVGRMSAGLPIRKEMGAR
jgi:hypothetical protein